MKFYVAAVFSVMATLGAAQNCWDSHIHHWSADCGRGKCSFEENNSVCICNGCGDDRFTSPSLLCCA
ncbi:hypothetical protein EsH8_VII_000196 [Colletotrichum jinshuiense]